MTDLRFLPKLSQTQLSLVTRQTTGNEIRSSNREISSVQRIQLWPAGDPRRSLAGVDADLLCHAPRDHELRRPGARGPRHHHAGRLTPDLALREHGGAEPVHHAARRGQRRDGPGRAHASARARRAGLQLPLHGLVRGEAAPVRPAPDRVQDQHLLRLEPRDEGLRGGARAVGGDGAVRGGEERAGGVEVHADGRVRVRVQGQVREEEGRVERRRGGEEREGGGGDEDDEEARGRWARVGGNDEDGGGLRWRSGEVVEVVRGEAGRRRHVGDDVLHGAGSIGGARGRGGGGVFWGRSAGLARPGELRGLMGRFLSWAAGKNRHGDSLDQWSKEHLLWRFFLYF